MNPFHTALLDPKRVPEVIVTGDPARPERYRGSGYRVNDGIVLTAAHVVAGATEIDLRFNADQDGEWTSAATVVFSDTDIDVALLQILRVPEGDLLPEVAYGRIEDADGEVTCSMIGFPRSSLRRDRLADFQLGTTEYRDSLHVLGLVSPWSNLREGTLSIRVPPPEYSEDESRSPWEGMSGTAVWGNGQVIAVVTQHHRSDGLGRLTASRVDRWYTRLSPEKMATLRGLLNLPAAVTDLTLVPVLRSASATAGARAEEALRALLIAQVRAAEEDPYRFLELQRNRSPYIEPNVSLLTESWESSTVTASAPVVDTLLGVNIALVQGQPGAGKTALTQHVAGTLARRWLELASNPARDPDIPAAIPVRVLARDLTNSPGTLATAIRESSTRLLQLYLSSSIPEDMFEHGVLSARWLVIVDGLDEIGDTVTRRRLIMAIAQDSASSDSPYRWLLTTRNLTQPDIELLRGVGAAMYRLEPFDDGQLNEFVASWLGPAKDQPGQIDSPVRDFLRESRRLNIDQLVRNPLLGAISLVLYQSRADTFAAASRLALYGQFISFLLNGREGEETRRNLLESATINRGGSERLANWLYAHRLDIATAFAESEDQPRPWRTTATNPERWVGENAPESTEFVIGLGELLIMYASSTGLVRRAVGGDGHAWLHRTFADFLVARSEARRLSAMWQQDAPQELEVLSVALGGADPDLAILTLACWADRTDTDSRALLESLLRGSREHHPGVQGRGAQINLGGDSSALDRHIVLAAALLAEGCEVPEDVREEVLTRLLARVRSMFNTLEYCSAIAALPDRAIARQRLQDVVEDASVPIQARSGAAVAIGWIFGAEAAVDAAGVLLLSGSPTRAVLADKVNDSVVGGQVSDSRVLVASDLARLGRTVTPTVKEILGKVRLPPSDAFGRVFAAEAALAVEDHELARQLVVGIQERESSGRRTADSGESPGWMADLVLSILVRAGDQDEVDRRVERYFSGWSQDRSRDQALRSVCDAYLQVGRTEDAIDLAERVRANPGQRGDSGWVYRILAQAGRTEVALDALNTAVFGYGPDATMTFHDWDRLARLLWSRNYREAVRRAARRLIDLCDNSADLLGLADLLRDIGEPDSDVVLLAAARAPHKNQIRYRLEPINRLLDTRFRDEAREILVELAHSPLNHSDIKSVALCMRTAGLHDEAKSMLRRQIDAEHSQLRDVVEAALGLEELGFGEVEDLRAIARLVSTNLAEGADLTFASTETDLLQLSTLLFRNGGRRDGITFVRRIVELQGEKAQKVTFNVLRQMEEVMHADDAGSSES